MTAAPRALLAALALTGAAAFAGAVLWRTAPVSQPQPDATAPDALTAPICGSCDLRHQNRKRLTVPADGVAETTPETPTY